MLMAHPTVLRNLVERYEALRARDENGEPGGAAAAAQLAQQLQDTVYTLCVSTGTREIGAALAAAREHIERFTYAARGAVDGTAA
ncbi:DUF5133 domain-containing protein [Streptomyces sp. HPF1205]|uniref:DUF5133 domain-containing protein n=1 Tax=Streptomyces sp. HPF1205 TaxID=2873262 RepID=UPI001CEC9F31|nr:DUF5133 domain-containing protein [Streptomyces sp. HPF1205]